jgi:hypothetical protein
MKKLFILGVLILTAVSTSCQEDAPEIECCSPFNKATSLTGNWQVFERGYSPGDRYIIEEVPASPAQNMSFGVDNTFSSNITGLEDYSFFKLLEDSNIEGGIVLALFAEIADMKSADPVNLEHSYSLEQYSDGNIKLGFRYCFEGCHLALKKVQASSESE